MNKETNSREVIKYKSPTSICHSILCEGILCSSPGSGIESFEQDDELNEIF